MSTAEEAAGRSSAKEKSPEELRRDIEKTREQLGDTVEALAGKTDVKAQAKRRISELQGAARQKRDEISAKAKAAASDGSSAGAQQVATAKAQELAAAAKNTPLPLAVGSALVVGYLLGRGKSN